MNILPEDRILCFALKSRQNLNTVVYSGISPDYFENRLRQDIAHILFSSFLKYRTLPSQEHILSRLQEEGYAPQDFDLAKSTLSRLSSDPEPEDIEFWIDELKKCYNARLMLGYVEKAVNCLSTKLKIDEAVSFLDEAIKSVDLVSASDKKRTLSVSDADYAQKRLDDYIKTKERPDNVNEVKTGIPSLDNCIHGVRPGELCVFAGRHGCGKSVILNTIAHNCFKEGKNVVFAGLEMDQDINAMRFDALYAYVSYSRLRRGCLTPEEEERYREALSLLPLFPNKLYIIPRSRCQTIEDITREIVSIKNKDGVRIDAVMIDYLNILSSERLRRHLGNIPIFQQQKELAEACRQMGFEQNCAVFTAAQSNRQGIDKNRTGSTEVLALSDFIGATADIVIRLIRGEEERESNTIVADVIKHRHGSKETIVLAADLDKMYIGDIGPEHFKQVVGDITQDVT